MTSLTVIADQLAGTGTRAPGGIGRYTQNLVAALTETIPPGSRMRTFIAGHPTEARMRVRDAIPGVPITASPLPPPVLSRLWQRGLPVGAPRGSVHAPGLLAAYPPRSRVVTTFHDTVPWTRPETLTPHGVAWHRAMAEQAWRHATAVVTSTHAVAAEIAELYDFGDRVHVIPPAVSPTLTLPLGSDGTVDGVAVQARAATLGLPESYVLSVGTLEPRKALSALLHALALPGAPDLPLVVVGPEGWGGVSVAEAAERAGLNPGRVHVLGHLSDSDLAIAYAKATIFALPSLAEGFGLPLLEAFNFGVPSLCSDDPSLVELAAGAACVVERPDTGPSWAYASYTDTASADPAYAERLAATLAELATDTTLRGVLSAAARARAVDFNWHATARTIWALHTG